MIGLFDSGHGGLTVLRALVARFPRVSFTYLGDHRHVPYGNRPSHEIVALTRDGVEALFEQGAAESALEALVAEAVSALLAQTRNTPPHRAILGCTHYPLVEHLFRRHLPAATRLLTQPALVADSLEDYLARHPHYVAASATHPHPVLLTTGAPTAVSAVARTFWPQAPAYTHLARR